MYIIESRHENVEEYLHVNNSKHREGCSIFGYVRQAGL
jgi:hypothetical protein